MSETDHRPASPVDEKATVGAAKAAARPATLRGSSNPNMNGPLYMQTAGSNVVLVRKLKRKDVGTWRSAVRWFVENQIGLSFNLIALLFLAHAFIPKARAHTRKYFHLSYPNPDTGRYGVGFDDAYVILSCIVLFMGLRAWTMEYVLAPFARFQGITKRKDLTRFIEQAWLLVYYWVFWPLGVYIYCTSPYYMNLREMWTHWPDREITGLMKGYVLMQLAFWLQQMIVINIEDRRKDHWQMFSHHVITSILIVSCLAYHHTPVGNVILVIMDFEDIALSGAKCLKYLGFTTLCDFAFAFFMASWFALRHVAFSVVIWSIYAHTPEIMPVGCFKGTNANMVGPIDPPPGLTYLIEPFYKPTGLVCYNNTVKWAFLLPLMFLQALMILWFTMIVRVAAKVLSGKGAEDNRSDDECCDEEEEDEYVYEEAEAVQQEVGVEALNLRTWERRHTVKSSGGSSGVSLPGHSDRKELLGRIGCEKQVD